MRSVRNYVLCDGKTVINAYFLKFMEETTYNVREYTVQNLWNLVDSNVLKRTELCLN